MDSDNERLGRSLALHLKQRDPPREHLSTDLLKSRQMRVGIEFDGGAVQSRGLEFVGEGGDHGVDLRPSDFHVKEEAVRVFVIAESLMGSESGRSQHRRAAWKIEDIAVPVESHEGTRFPMEYRVFSGKAREINPVPAGFLLSSRIDIRAECGGEELTTEADAENGPAVLQCIFDEAHFLS